MNKIISLMLLVCLVLFIGCKHDDDDNNTPVQPRNWSAKLRFIDGNPPVPSPVNRDILIGWEKYRFGFFVLRDTIAVPLNPYGPTIEPDYAWSNDGTKCCFSSPGAIGYEAGIHYGIVQEMTDFYQIWDRGSHPRFLPGDQYIICAGPGYDTEYEGIWQIKISDRSRSRLTLHGVEPEVSPDGEKIAFLVPQTANNANLLVVYYRFTFEADTIATQALQFAWLGDSQTLIYHTVKDGGARLYRAHLGGTTLADTLDIHGIYPCGFKSGTDFVYTALQGDTVDGVYLCQNYLSSTLLLSAATMPRVGNENWIVAQTPTGIWEISR
jgi:hypothetical protein